MTKIRYQKLVYFFLFLPTIFSAMQKMAWVFLGGVDGHRCRTPADDGEASFDSAPSADGGCTYRPGNGTPAVACDRGYVYEKSYFGSSAVMDWDLVCDDKKWAATAQSIFMLGVLVGSYVFGEASDKLGRKPTFLASVAIQFVFGVASSIATNYWTFVSLRLVVGKSQSVNLILPAPMHNFMHRNDDIRGVLSFLRTRHGDGT